MKRRAVHTLSTRGALRNVLQMRILAPTSRLHAESTPSPSCGRRCGGRCGVCPEARCSPPHSSSSWPPLQGREPPQGSREAERPGQPRVSRAPSGSGWEHGLREEVGSSCLVPSCPAQPGQGPVARVDRLGLTGPSGPPGAHAWLSADRAHTARPGSLPRLGRLQGMQP